MGVCKFTNSLFDINGNYIGITCINKRNIKGRDFAYIEPFKQYVEITTIHNEIYNLIDNVVYLPNNFLIFGILTEVVDENDCTIIYNNKFYIICQNVNDLTLY